MPRSFVTGGNRFLNSKSGGVGGCVGVGVDVDFGQYEVALRLAGQALEDRAEHSTRSAPGSPEIHDHRYRLRRFHDICHEGRFGTVFYQVICDGCRAEVKVHSDRPLLSGQCIYGR